MPGGPVVCGHAALGGRCIFGCDVCVCERVRFGAARGVPCWGDCGGGGVMEFDRAIRTARLHALLHFHLRPIDVVVFHGSQGIPCFEGGFTLRCLQRLSCPFIATLHCRWHDNRSTSGTFTPVLSY